MVTIVTAANSVKTQAIFFPFDLFDGSGGRAGVELLADGLREMLADNRRERKPTRARAYANKVHAEEFVFDQLADYQDWRGQARLAAKKVFRGQDRLLWIAASHLGLLPVYETLGALPGTNIVVQFDAHLDIHHFSDSKTELSHGNFLLHADGPLPIIFNLGHRDLLLTKEYVASYYHKTFSTTQLATNSEMVLEALRELCAPADRIFIDIDCDVFDPAYFPATAHPLPFGMAPPLLLRCLESVWSNKVVGLAFSEFDPGRDVRDQSLSLLLWLVEWLLLQWHEKPASVQGGP